MSMFGSLLGDMEDDPFFGSHMRTMRQMNSMMNSLFADPFGMMNNYGALENRALTAPRPMHNALMPFGMPPMMGPSFNLNRLLGGSLGNLNELGTLGHSGHSYSSSTVVSMTSGLDGRPQQVYKATSSTRVAPGGIKETQRTVTDSASGTKKMAIGHHIGERAHIIEKEQNMRTGDREEREDFINLEEEEAEDFNREWETKARNRSDVPRIMGSGSRNRHSYGGHSSVPAITAGSGSRRHNRERHNSNNASYIAPRRSIRASPLVLPSTSSTSVSSSLAANRTPYSPPGAPQQPRKSKIKTVSGSPPSPDM